jgi:thioredoxin reductase (NADPH)
MDLARRAVTQATRFGAEILSTQVATGVRVQDPYRVVTLSDGSEVSCKAILLATGAAFRRLEVPGIEALTSAGVYYGAAYTEATYYKDQPVFVVGGANSAGQGAMFLSRFASKVTMIIRRDVQWSSKYLVDAEAANPKIERLLNTEVVEIHGVWQAARDRGREQPDPGKADPPGSGHVHLHRCPATERTGPRFGADG